MQLFVLGNGFDIGHKIPCKYSDFYDYVKENRGDILEIMEKYYYVGNDSDLWSDFESSLEEDIDYDSLADIIGENIPNTASDDFRDGDWYDAQIYIEQDCDELLESIRSGFEEWIESLEISKVKKVYQLDMSATFITFNYTEVLERVYKISSTNILHIHNKVGEELVFGHGKKSEDFNVKKALYGNEKAFLNIDKDGNIESNEVGHEHFAENAVSAFYDKMRKCTEEIVPKQTDFIKNISIDEIIILGHSYNEIDFPYFKEIGKSIGENTKWTLHYFSDADKQLAEKTMRELKINDSLIHYKHCTEIEIEDTQLKLFSI
ncbi:hypothetical protein DWB61_17450 [Ancylomarina euxinus]|uniref:Bacteriophage abortive infection AbiH n=1 Tax=Ancylomarina euxinus TaxID=2283627 RepID=A0A425XWF7_9BACT|nr:bacteriophage abortive infection AbiH family protein [Ancylomarina euxinus]MCZ4696448.1 bacteriophage abortive infection AbiH family protein [Ancylomarina euxinus]RRG18973.1 hypothetical protein DWB61_17450 [Ancylomarina euxinus]